MTEAAQSQTDDLSSTMQHAGRGTPEPTEPTQETTPDRHPPKRSSPDTLFLSVFAASVQHK